MVRSLANHTQRTVGASHLIRALTALQNLNRLRDAVPRWASGRGPTESADLFSPPSPLVACAMEMVARSVVNKEINFIFKSQQVRSSLCDAFEGIVS